MRVDTSEFASPWDSATLYRYGSYAAAFAFLLLLGMLGVSLATGVDQHPFEIIRDLSQFEADLLSSATPLRWVLTLDMLFAASYTVSFVVLAIACFHESHRFLGYCALSAMLATAVLDLHENHDILAMLETVEAGRHLGFEQVKDRAVLSQLKFHLSYLALVIFGLLLPERTWLEKTLRWSLIFVQMPLGVLVYTFPHDYLVLARYIFFLGGMGMLASIFWQRHRSLR